MGFFSKPKKREEKKGYVQELKKYEIRYSATSDKMLQVDFWDKNTKFGQDYNMTRLLVDSKPEILANEIVYKCKVSWYKSDDVCIVTPGQEMESINATDYKEILAQVDPILLRDENYCVTVMRSLLNKGRVMSYLERGLQEKTAETPCGEYIGGVRILENGYDKFFSPNIGRASHNSQSMERRRERHRKEVAAEKSRQIRSREERINKLKEEIKEYEQ